MPDAVPADAPQVGPYPTRFVFIDTEATGLDHRRHELTEVAWIARAADGTQVERQYFPEHSTDGADADALELTRYAERIAPQPRTPAREWLAVLLEDARDAVLVGAVPDFDARHLERMCHKVSLTPTWDYHLLDVGTLVLPLLAPGPEAPRGLARACEALGIPHDRDQAHGALYDARQAMRVFDAVWETIATLRRTGAPLPAPVPRVADDANGTRAKDATQADDSPDSDSNTGDSSDSDSSTGDNSDGDNSDGDSSDRDSPDSDRGDGRAQPGSPSATEASTT